MKPKNLDEFKLFDQIFLLSDRITYAEFKRHIDKKKKFLVIFLKRDLNNHLIDKFFKFENIQFLNFQWNLISEYKQKWIPEKKSIESVEKNFFDYNNKISLKILSGLYNSEKIKICIKKKISEDLRDILLQSEVLKILKQNNLNILGFLNSTKFSYYIKNNFLEKKDFPEKDIVLIKSNILNVFFEKIKFLTFFFVYPFYFIINAKKISIFKKEKKLGVRVYKNGFGFNPKKINLNWMVEKLGIESSKILFIFETEINKDHLIDIKYQNFDYTFGSIKKPCNQISLYFIFQLIFFYTPMCILFSPIIIFSSKNFLIKEYFKSICFLYIWKNLTYCYNFKNYISYQDFSPSHICRNLILKKKNTQTLMFKHTHSENIFDYKNKNFYAHSEMLNLYYDIEFHWSKCSVEMSQSNNSISNLLEISGPIWASSELINKSLKQSKKIITLFSSSFEVKNSITSNEGHKNFMIFIYKILQMFPNYKIQLKPKYPLSVYDKDREILNILNKIKEFKNFNLCNYDTPSYDVINESDLIISTAFSSPTVEAIFMGKKSFYIDISNAYKNNYFSNFKNFVVHTIDDGLKNIDLWLKMSPQEFDNLSKLFHKEMQVRNSLTPISILKSRLLT